MKITMKHMLLLSFLSLAVSACEIGLSLPLPSPPTQVLVAPTADAIRASLVTASPYCMEPGFAWSCITIDECTSRPGTEPVTDIVYDMTDLPYWLTFYPDTRQLCLSIGSTVVPSYTDAFLVTYRCTSESDPSVTASVSLVINDCDGGGDIDAHEDANSAMQALLDNTGYLFLTVHDVDEYLVPGATGGARKIRSNMVDMTGMDVLSPVDDTEDFDGDGTVNMSDPNVFVAASDASLAGSATSNAQQVEAIASGDLNNDGHPDLLVSAYTFPFPPPPPWNGRISTYLWNPVAGNFDLPATNGFAGINTTITDLAVADFEGDGNLDAVATARGDFTIFRARGDGTGSLKLEQSIVIGGTPRLVAAADFDGDRDIDVAVGSGNVDLLIYLNDGTGNLVAGSAYVTCGLTDMVTADFDRDGKMDIAVTCSIQNIVRIHYGDGNGQFTATWNYDATHPAALTVADFDLDGNLDLAMSCNDVGIELQVILCNGNRTCDLVRTFHVSSSNAFEAADMNGDGFPDIAGAGKPTLNVLINELGSTGTLDFTETSYNLGALNGSGITAADYDGDNMIDLALANSNGPGLLNVNIFMQ